MMPAKRKNPDSTPPPPLRRSKRLAQCQDVAISVDQSSDGRGDEETNVSYSGDSYEEMSKSVSQVDSESDSDGETYGESESDGPSGALKLPNLSAFAKRPIIEERSVAVGKLRKITRVPQLLKDLGLHPICKYEGKANWTLVREFFAGINPFKVDQVERIMVSTVRGHTIRLTPDRLGQFKKIARPRETEKQYPYLPGVERPTFHDIWMTLCHGSWPPEDSEDNPNPKIRLNILKKDFVLLHHIFWWNVYPKSPRHELNGNQAMLLHAVYNGYKPDIPRMWWDSIYEAWTNDHPIASLPLGHLLTGFIHHGRKLPNLIQDKWGKVQISVIGPGTIGKSEGQSKLHRKVTNPASLEGLRDMILTVQENQISMWEKLRRVEHAVCPDYDEDEDSFGDE
ncbi:hypothetical protein RHGRI_000832 [Rhododendron griersonianum]|uniref:Putative plant transposon protein domain-containing protein n=1 Tax=Rhododendron griersonianum TaxID=479676 RepID=A0AAV6LID9_9ERIC|nr:hypothetical protein RHGRI_000832 [Rhododendron griersonianum]